MKRHQLGARNEEIIRLARLKVPSKRIAALTRCSLKTVQRVRAANEVQTQRTLQLTEEQLAQAHALLLDGASRREAARTVGATDAQLERAFPGMAWDREQQRLGEHDTGVRNHTDPFRRKREPDTRFEVKEL